MMSDLFNLAALATICGVSICRLNLMTGETRRSVKLAYIALSGGAFAEGLSILMHEPSGVLHALLVVGIAGMLITERRRLDCYRRGKCQ